MPAKSAKQARFMRACAHNPESMDKPCPSKEVAREFMHVSTKSPKGKKGKSRR